MAFHNVLFPPQISYGSRGGPAFRTTIIPLASGIERRNAEWRRVRAEYDVSHGIKDQEQMKELREFFYARLGMAHSFKFLDHGDFEITDQNVAEGDGILTEFQIIKSYNSGAYQYDRVITKFEVDSDLPVEVDGTPLVKGVDYTLNYTNGVITFTDPPADGDVINLPYIRFYVHCRFDTDHLDAVHDFWLTESWESIPIVEVKEAE